MIWLILLLALALRIITINQPLWLDEADNVVAAGMFDFISFITKYSIGDYHPPGYFILIWLWTHLFGYSEAIVRMPSVLLGVGTVCFTYLLGKELFNRKTALIAALFLAVAPLHVYYSQEARMYSFSAFAVSISFYFLIKWIKGGLWARWGYLASVVLILYSDYVTYLILPAHLLVLISYRKDFFRAVREIGVIWGLSFIFFLPWLSVFPQQIMVGQKAALDLPGWKQVAGGADFKNLALVWIKTLVGRISFENRFIYGGVVGILSGLWGIGVIRGIREVGEPRVKFLLLWFIIPLILAWGISFFIPMLSYFRMVYILPAFYLLAAYGIFSLSKNFSRILIAVVVFSSLFFLNIYYTTPKFQREDWRSAAVFLENVPESEAIVLFEDNHVKFPYLYYQKAKVPAYGGLKNIQAKSAGDVADIGQLLGEKNKIYLFEYLVEITDPARLLQKEINRLGFTQKDVYNFNGVGLIRMYERSQ